MSQEEFDERKSELRKAEADVRNAIAGIASAKAAVISAKAAEASARAAVAIAELNLEYTTVTAPVSGRISRNQVSTGNLIQAGQSGGGTLLTTIVSVDPMYAYFDVDEHTVLRVKQLIREGKAKSPDDVEIPVWLGLANEDGIPAPGNHQLHRQSGSSQYRHSAGAGRLPQQGRSARRRAISPASACPSAIRTKPCSSPIGHWTRTRGRRSFTSWTRRTRWTPDRFASGHCTTACARSPTA